MALRSLGTLLCAAALSVGSASPLGHCVVPATQLLRGGSTCRNTGSASDIAVEGFRGEREAVQVLVEPSARPTELRGMQYRLEGNQSRLTLEVLQVGFVNCATTKRYGGSGGGWTSDPLLPIFADGATQSDVSFNVTDSAPLALWVVVVIPEQPVEGKLVLEFGSAAASVEVDLTASPWLHLPPMPERKEVQKLFPQIWAFDDSSVDAVYGQRASEVLASFHDTMSAHYLPPDALYKGSPYANMSFYTYLHQTAGAYLLNIASIGGCNEQYTNATVDSILAKVAPAIDKILAKNWDARPYVYGFDEVGQSCEHNIRLLYGTVKERYGDKVLTVSAMNPMENWKSFSADMPIDIIAHQYQYTFPEDFVQEWQARGKQIFFYHCIEPSGATYLNTFIERPRIGGRAMYWYGAARNVSGWLYYATDLWKGARGSTHTPVQRLSSTSQTDFDPANYIWYPQIPTLFANGDGQFLYPGSGGALRSARLDLQRDAVEDYVLLAAALRSPAASAKAKKLIAGVVSGPTTHDDSASGLLTARAAIASLLKETQ